MNSLRESRKKFIKSNSTEEVNKIALSANYDKRIQSIDSQKHMHMEQAKI